MRLAFLQCLRGQDDAADHAQAEGAARRQVWQVQGRLLRREGHQEALRRAQPRAAVQGLRGAGLRRDHGAQAHRDRGAVGSLRGLPQQNLQALKVMRS